MDSLTNLVAVFGATRNQGGSVARSLLQNPSFQVRAITRNPGSDASQLLASQGAEGVRGGAFVNLNSDDKVFTNPDGPTEFDLGKTIIHAAAQAGVQHLVFSTGPPCTETTGGKVDMKAMDMKYKIEQYAKQLDSFQSIIPIGAGWFLENFLGKEVAPIFGGFLHFPDAEGLRPFRIPYWGGEENVPWLSISGDFEMEWLLCAWGQ
ncbi:hypothetical protein AWENTII_004584 [Aspergillus wentii]